ncbi:ABC transporter permease [Undibacterium umbellatum]|uniref:ABC transporter permease n=1 Tax=Undibacterium umbellatum TaxID=2762300 RepID=A0ABR6ZDN1_9BURK|nr:ABC transporter permease [Undibacterium umbellatum]MBC3909861.1 ABC transporter permease [Undibacterium umbellatum]
MSSLFDRIWWSRLQAMTWKELLQLMRDPILLVFVLYAFSADIYNAASGVSFQLNNAALVLFDLDRSAASRELAGRFMPPEFRWAGAITHASQGQKMLDDGKAMAVLDIPPDFSERLARGDTASVQMQIDASNSVQGFLAAVDATQIVARYGLEQTAQRLGVGVGGTGGNLDAPLINNQTRVWFNPNQNDAWFMGISELLNVITLFSMLLPAAAMVREKERGTIEQLLVSPLSPWQIMIPKIVAMVAVILGGTALGLFGILVPVFAVPVAGSLLLFFVLTTLYVSTLAGIGILIATMTRNMAQAGMMVILIIAPMMFLSGAWTPPEAMPALMRLGMYVSPLYYYINASYGILMKGAGISVLWPMFAGIFLIGVLVSMTTIVRFKKQFA